MKAEKPKTIYRRDYQPPPFFTPEISLRFQLEHDSTTVTANASYSRNRDFPGKTENLFLAGEELELLSLRLNGQLLGEDSYRLDEKGMELLAVPEAFELEVVTRLYPDKNTSLEGLYRSSGNYCTQCEAEGFRKITYFQDRPDVLTRYTTTIEADSKCCPVILANGNLIQREEIGGGRTRVVWQDPFPKPCYLFALVAGDLVALEDEFVTRSGRVIRLEVFVEPKNAGKCEHAMTSLKKAMSWDEDVYGLEYDLDRYMIVAVDDFNMGAMENKGLNIFNSKYVLSTPESATDQDYLGIEGVIAHEYFHNWTGNRVTCRDWFQLSLKEGLTVFRDQEFSADMNSRAVQRIDDVRVLKNFQFREDGGPMAHPVRPDSYVEINNFYTSTVYNKGAEVIRMMHTLLGPEKFRQGMDLYFQRHDGQAVTCDDFRQAMSDASGVDLEQFELWYQQSGTPVLEVQQHYEASEKRYKLKISQSCPETPAQKTKRPFHIPISLGLVGKSNANLLPAAVSATGTTVVELREREELFVFDGIEEKPVLSLLRDFSAPVRVKSFQSRDELAFLMHCDPNLFNRWDAASRLYGEVILEVTDQFVTEGRGVVPADLLDSFASLLAKEPEDQALLALALQLPSEITLAQEMSAIDPDSLHKARNLVKTELAKHTRARLEELYHRLEERGPYTIDPEAMGRRSLRNTVLGYLAAVDPLPAAYRELIWSHFAKSTNMTDCISALGALSQLEIKEREQAIQAFYQRWQKDSLVLDKWFSIQATSQLAETLTRVKGLMGHPAFAMTNPNKVRSLIGAFCAANHYRFHSPEGAGYAFLGDVVLELNTLNPQIAARMAAPLINWQRYDSGRQQLMLAQLNRIAEHEGVSKDVYEIVDKGRQL